MSTQSAEAPSYDSISLGIFWDRLIAIADEMMTSLIRTAFSSMVRETHDCSANLFDARGRAIAQASSAIPSFTGAAPLTLAHMLAKCPPETMRPGDIYITNDPWMGSGHMFDVSVMRPAFRGSTLVGYCLSVSHLPDVGGSGWSPETREMYQEGLRLPISQLFRAGERNEWLVELICGNVRVSEQVMGDLMANVACTAVGERLVVEFLSEYGLGSLDPIGAQIIDVSERAMRDSLRRSAPGTYRNEVVLEGRDDPIALRCAVTVADGAVSVDFTGTQDAIAWGMNVPMCYTRAMTGYALKCLFLPGIPNNDGVMLPISITAPEGCIVHATPPMATAGRHTVGHALYPLVMGALAGVLPHRVQAESGGGNMLNVRGEFRGRSFTQVYFCAGGYGALSGFDGHPTTPVPSNPRGISIEAWESRTGLTIEAKEFLADSGGAGASRGGLGQRVRMRNTTGAPAVVSCFSGRTDFPAQGYAGGGSGGKRRYLINDRPVASKRAHTLQPGDVLTTEEAGGGAYGPPGERPDLALARDLARGYVTQAGLAEDYGLDETRIAALLEQAKTLLSTAP